MRHRVERFNVGGIATVIDRADIIPSFLSCLIHHLLLCLNVTRLDRCQILSVLRWRDVGQHTSIAGGEGGA